MKRIFIVTVAVLAMLAVSSCKNCGQPQDGEEQDLEMVDSTIVEVEQAVTASKPARRDGLMMDLKDGKMEKAEDVLQKAAAKSHEAGAGDLQ